MAAVSAVVVAIISGEVVAAVSGEFSTTLLATGVGWTTEGDSYPLEGETGGMTPLAMEEDGTAPPVPVPIGAVVVPLP